jgi:hypothetical protein
MSTTKKDIPNWIQSLFFAIGLALGLIIIFGLMFYFAPIKNLKPHHHDKCWIHNPTFYFL